MFYIYIYIITKLNNNYFISFHFVSFRFISFHIVSFHLLTVLLGLFVKFLSDTVSVLSDNTIV